MECLDNGRIAVEVPTEFGPRVTRLRPEGGDNLFAELGDLGFDLDDGRRFQFRGGHRLWTAPEVPEITYEPDDGPVEVAIGSTFIEVTGLNGGIEKTIKIATIEGEREIVLDHRLVNRGVEIIEVAPWAITQLPPGGTALMPLGSGQPEAGRLRPWTSIVGWSYTDWGALRWDDRHGVVQVPGTRETPTKIGTALLRGWLAYLIDGWVFAKYATLGSLSIDFGASGQVYANKDFVELETLGAFVTLAPGESTAHREVWRVWPNTGDVAEAIEQVEEQRG